ncbi:ATPase AAA [Dictyobacter vulcani]|uniref:ATPase AAA n=1 Tax=Dictyobacter vulcani TaxID=2607529 RepID=A0A5J4KJ40_9CHLR|nr:ATP-binding protein [Dictyobacter vulcani]GER89728.1 ATPase AAA [Dictyobacter vulcani]
MNQWKIYTGKGEPHDGIRRLPPPPPWRNFTGHIVDTTLVDEDDDFMRRMLARGEVFQASEEVVDMVNAALYLRRPLLVSGKPGYGKSSLAYAVARELQLGSVFRWSITTRTTLADGLYSYDAIARLQDTSYRKDTHTDDAPPDIGQYIRLGPLGAALLPTATPRVLLIDEVDKSDIDLPNDLLHIFEEGEFDIPELVRISQQHKSVEVYYGRNSIAKVPIEEGHVRCAAFPFIIMTSNEEREFPPAFLRRCIRLTMKEPTKEELVSIVEAHLGSDAIAQTTEIIDDFINKRKSGDLATDQLLNAVYLASRGFDTREKSEIFQAILKNLTT